MAGTRKMSNIIYFAGRITDCKGEGKEKQYLIKWEGYPEESNTWEPASCIMDKNAIKVFEQERLENAVTQDVAALDQRANEKKPGRGRPRSLPSGNENEKKKPNARQRSEPAKAKHEKETKTSQQLGRGRKRVHPPSDVESSSKKIVTNDVSDVAVGLPKPLRSKKQESPERNRAPELRRSNRNSKSNVGNDGMASTQAFEHEPEAIIGATDQPAGRLHFVVKWKGPYKAALVPAKLANERCPQLVIKYYEARLRWRPAPGPEKRQ